MSAALIIYLAGIVDAVKVSAGIFSFLFCCGVFVGCIGFFSTDSENKYDIGQRKNATLALKIFIPFLLATGLIFILTPRKETIYLMAGAKVTQDIVTSPEAKEIGGKVLQIINEKLDSQLEEKKK